MPPRNYRNTPRRSRFPRLMLAGLGIFTLMTVGIVGTLWLAGVPLNPFAARVTEDPFMVRIPINAQPIPAYTRVDRSQMINPATGGLMFQKVPPNSTIGLSIVGIDQQGSHADGRIESVKRVGDEVVFVLADQREVRQSQTMELGGALLNINSILGRVVKRDKRAGLGFQESTFFPQGTPEGIAGATPVGMRAITLDATKLSGVHALAAGDQIDLMASFPTPGNPGETNSLLTTSPTPANSKKGEASEPHLLAEKAVVLKPVYVRNEAATSASLTQGTRVQNIPKYEVAIAVKPDDLIPLQRALNQSLAITCIAHSMKPVSETQAQEPANESDTVMVPVTVHPVLAYNVVTREAFVSTATRAIKFEAIAKSQVARMDIITALDEALGAVAKHDIPAGRFLRRTDLLSGPPDQAEPIEKMSTQQMPRGTAHPSNSTHQFVSLQEPANEPAPLATAVGDRPAITRFVPPGRTAFAIPWNRVYGSEHLQIGDEIDLMVSYSLESKEKKEETETRADGTVIVRKTDALSVRETERSWGNSFGFRAEPWFVATDAIVIAPVGFPPPASAIRALGEQLNRPSPNTENRTGLGGPPVIIAVDDRDVEAVTAALATQDALFSVGFHSNNPVGASAGRKQIVVVSEPLSPYQEFNESVWQGNRRRITTRMVASDDARFDDALTVEDVRLYYGRVFGRAKSRGDSLTAADFLPPGTKPGLAAGVKAGFTFFPVADREIEGLDSFNTEDHVAILVRGVVKPVAGIETTGIDYSQPISTVVVADARIARASLAGQTVLSIANRDLAALQAAIAHSQTYRQQNERSNLIAVVRPRTDATETAPTTADELPAFDPFSNVRYTETIIGGKRSVKAFIGGTAR